MASITIDGLDEEIFRRNIEAMLRVGEADRAALKLRALIEPFAGEGKILPARFLHVTAADFLFEGWDQLGESLARNDLPRNPISALTIAVSDAEAMGIEPAPDDPVGPLIATSHFTDEAYMFSQCAVSDLLDGYSFYGCEWHGSSTHMDTALSLRGVEDLYRAVAQLEADLIANPQPALDRIRAGSLASCYLAVLLYLAVRDTIRAHGLPRPLCVMAGNEGVYPYFDAPVIGTAECAEQGLVNGAAAPESTMGASAMSAPVTSEQQVAEEPGKAAEAGVAYARLGELTGRKGEKKMVLELAEADLRSAAELFDRAGEERMTGDRFADDGGPAPADLLAHRGPSHPLFAPQAPELPEPEWSEPETPHPLSSEPLAPVPAGLDPFASPGSFPELVEAGSWPAAPDAGPALRARPLHEPAADELAADEPEPLTAEPEPFRAMPSPSPTPSHHSLRARFAEPALPPPPPAPSWLYIAGTTLLRWLHNIFG